ncbi:hypothetical protein [Candidatus Bathycorpusculum sp.]|uniref:hypothetical protein n=1 Tax=Candidatus Bathycorpusculum sp. TaxID=2994959 RepID=UPI00282E5BDE|nr:hypothetical protein [Candidatus Termitimicrobium sp.]
MSGSIPQISAQKTQKTKTKSSPLKTPEYTRDMSINKPIHDYAQRIKRNRHNIQQLPNGTIGLQFLDHLNALGLSLGRVSKCAAHLPVLLRIINGTDIKTMTKTDIEHIVAQINSRPNKESTKADNKLLLRKVVQYAKQGSCAKNTPTPPEVNWISLTVKEKNPKITPENLLTQEEITAILVKPHI